MNYLKKLSLALVLVAFCLSLWVATSYAQRGRASWYGNNGKHKGWYKGKGNRWRNRNRIYVYNRYYPSYRRVYYPSYTRVYYPRYRTRNVYYYNNNYVSRRDRRNRTYNRYRRSVYLYRR